MKITIIIASLFLLTGTWVNAQTCGLPDNKGKCTGTCPPLYTGGQNPVQAMGKYECFKQTIEVPDPNNPKRKIKKQVCNCSLIRDVGGCEFPIVCGTGPRCPPLYRTIANAISGTDPIAGSCISRGTGQSILCGCQYFY